MITRSKSKKATLATTKRAKKSSSKESPAEKPKLLIKIESNPSENGALKLIRTVC